MLEDKDIERLKELFVTRQECQDTNEEINKKLANDSKELALINQKLDNLYGYIEQKMAPVTWVGKTTLGAVIVAIVGAFMLLILK